MISFRRILNGQICIGYGKYADLARTASAEGCVLLKNDNSTLPLKKEIKLLYLGAWRFIITRADLARADW